MGVVIESFPETPCLTSYKGSKLVQRGENPKFAQPGQVCSLFPAGGVVWKIPQRPSYSVAYYQVGAV